MIKIFDYTDYREFLKDMYKNLKENQESFSYRYFSMKCGYKSPNFLKLVIDGSRNLSAESIEKFSIFFKFTSQEKSFFKNLVFYNQAKTPEHRKAYALKLMNTSIYRRLSPLALEQFQFYANWYNLPILELLSLKKQRFNPKRISERLSPTVSEKEVKESLKLLLKLKLIKKVNNQFIPTSTFFSTGDEVVSEALKLHHQEMLELASSSIDNFTGFERDISSVTVSLHSKDLEELKKLTSKFRKDVLALSERSSNPQDIYQVGIQVFPLTKE